VTACADRWYVNTVDLVAVLITRKPERSRASRRAESGALLRLTGIFWGFAKAEVRNAQAKCWRPISKTTVCETAWSLWTTIARLPFLRLRNGLKK
jgi:hypothetical protein